MYKIKVKIKGCKNIDSLKEVIRVHNIKLVLFGEYHGFINQIQVQRKIIQNVQPDFFLYEMLEKDRILNDKDAKKFLSKPDNKDIVRPGKTADSIVGMLDNGTIHMTSNVLRENGVSASQFQVALLQVRIKELETQPLLLNKKPGDYLLQVDSNIALNIVAVNYFNELYT